MANFLKNLGKEALKARTKALRAGITRRPHELAMFWAIGRLRGLHIRANFPAKAKIKSSKQMRIQPALLLLAISADEILCAGGMRGARDILAFALGW